MPEKTEIKKKVVARKPVAAAKKTARKTAKSDKLVCETCGLSLIIDEWGDVYGEELICCGTQMKPKASKAKAAAK
jgi:hypothetical protein